MAGAAVGVIAKEGGAVASRKQLASTFGENEGGMNEVMSFLQGKNVSSEGLDTALKETFKEAAAEHHKDPAKALIATLGKMITAALGATNQVATSVEKKTPIAPATVVPTPSPGSPPKKPKSPFSLGMKPTLPGSGKN